MNIQCEKDIIPADHEFITIATNKSVYDKNEKIRVEIKNISEDTVLLHYFCRGSGYCVIDKIAEIDNNNWKVKDNINLCFWIVMSDYWGKLSPNKTVSDSIKINESGIYKLLTGFVYGNDTLILSSNEFKVR